MAAQLFSGRIFPKSLATLLAVSVVVALSAPFGTTQPARADHLLTHRAATPAAEPTGPSPASRAATLFKNGAEINIKRDANLYITARNIPENDRLLEAYSADRPDGGRVQTQFGEASAVPGLLGIANQAHRAQDPNGQNDQAYSLADAMRDAIWRKTTAARLKALTVSQSACAGGGATKTASIGLTASC